MQYVAIAFPPRIALGAQRRPGWNTALARTTSGFESTNQNWARARHSYDVSFAVRTSVDYHEIVEHFHAMRGRARSFPFRDALDYRVEASSGVIFDEGESPTTWRLAKRYGSGAEAYDRVITRPSSVVVYRLRSGNTTVITGSVTIDTSGGGITFGPGVFVGGDVISWSGQFDVPCRYDTDELPTLIVDKRPSLDGDYNNLLVRCDSIPIVEVREL